MDGIRLSICIPTYNFGAFIGETLASVASQVTEAVEVVVVDGASTDDTEEVVRSFQTRMSNLFYHRLEQKGGIDHDLARTVALARGEYCWFLSSDDVLRSGAVRKILSELDSHHDVYLCARTECDRSLSPFHDQRWLAHGVRDRTFLFRQPSDLIDYFNKAISIGALFSYISSLVVRRSAWRDAPPVEGTIGSNYAHVGRLFTVLQRGGTLRYLRDPLVFCRGYNDSFLRSGLVRRFQIDLDGYLLLAERLFPDEAVRRSFLSVMTRQHKWYVYVEIRSFIREKEAWRAFAQKLARFGYSSREIFLIDAFGSFRPGVRLARLLIAGFRNMQFLLARLRRPHRHAEGTAGGVRN